VTIREKIASAGVDGIDRLCWAVYKRAAKPSDYLGGSEAKMLHDAAKKIGELKEEWELLRTWISRRVQEISEFKGHSYDDDTLKGLRLVLTLMKKLPLG